MPHDGILLLLLMMQAQGEEHAPDIGTVTVAKKPTLTSLKEIIADLLGGTGLPFNPEDSMIWRVWDEVAGETVARNAQPLWIKNGRLRVKVSDPIWLQELSFMEESLKNELNRRLGRKAVEKIEFRLRSK